MRIEEEHVHQALNAICYAHSLADNPLLDLALVRSALERGGMDDTPQSRAIALAGCMQALVVEGLDELRGGHGKVAPGGTACGRGPEGDWARLRADLASELVERKAWGLLYYRYFATGRRPLYRVVEEMGIPRRTVSYRLKRGRLALTRSLRARERLAAGVAADSGAPARAGGDGPPLACPVALETDPALALRLLEMAGLAGCLAAGEGARAAHGPEPEHGRYVEILVRVDLGDAAKAGA